MGKHIRFLMVLVFIFATLVSGFQGKHVKAEVLSKTTSLGYFTPNDTALDPNKPVIYMTELGGTTLYAVNYTTGEIKTLELPYPTERMDLSNNKLYLTQQKMNHDYYTTKPLVGAIAEVNTEDFTLTKVFDIDTDPYDIVVDENGYAFVVPGSNQSQYLKVYSTLTGTEVPKTSAANYSIYMKSYLSYDKQLSKVYSITTGISPRDVDAFEVNNGVINSHYDSPYHGDYPLDPFAKISPDGLTMYNNSGVVFKLKKLQSGDMTYVFSLGKKYKDYEFSIDNQLTYAAGLTGGIDVYKYGTNEYLYTIKKNLQVEKLHYQNGQLIAIFKDSTGKYYVQNMDALATDAQEPFQLLSTFSVGSDGYSHDFYDGVQDIPMDSKFSFLFSQTVSVKDNTKITLSGPDGMVQSQIGVSQDNLTITPPLLKGSTDYTLTINKDAVASQSGQSLTEDIVLHFKTAAPAPLVLQNSQYVLSDGTYHNFYDGVQGVRVDSKLSFLLNQPINVKDNTKITLSSPTGMVQSQVSVSQNKLTISPPLLKGDTDYILTIKKDAIASKLDQILSQDIVVHFKTAAPDPLLLQESQFVLSDGSYDYYNEDFYDGVEDVILDSNYKLTFLFDQSISVKDNTKITISGPNGLVQSQIGVSGDLLTITPPVLKGNTNYVLTIKKDALTGPLGQTISQDMVIHFKTASNWEEYDGYRYYYDPAIDDYVTGWQKIDGVQYYFNEDAEMQTGWVKINNIWYYFDGTGAMKTGWLKEGNKWYYLTSSGAMKTGWLQLGKTWYYFDGSGVMKTGWQKIGNTWYYFMSSGAMKTGWLQAGKTWYYFDSNGAMKTGWVKVGTKWYYFYISGAMAVSTKIGSYRVDATGARI